MEVVREGNDLRNRLDKQPWKHTRYVGEGQEFSLDIWTEITFRWPRDTR